MTSHTLHMIHPDIFQKYYPNTTFVCGFGLFCFGVSARFATLAWSEMATKQAEYPYGLIAGGMGDGTVNVWDPAKLVASHPQPQVR